MNKLTPCYDSLSVSEHVTDKTVLLVTGDRGVGKSALLSHWLAEIERENPDMCVYYHFVGTIPGDSDITSFLRRSICSLRRQFYSRGIEPVFHPAVILLNN